MIVEPLPRDELTLHGTGHGARDVDGRLLLAANIGSGGKTNDQDQRHHRDFSWSRVGLGTRIECIHLAGRIYRIEDSRY
jgi:hypothetical protein